MCVCIQPNPPKETLVVWCCLAFRQTYTPFSTHLKTFHKLLQSPDRFGIYTIYLTVQYIDKLTTFRNGFRFLLPQGTKIFPDGTIEQRQKIPVILM